MTIKQKIYLTLFGIIIILFGLIWIGFKPLLARVAKLSQLIERQQIIIKNPDLQKQYQSQITQLKSDYQEIEPKLPLLKQSLLIKAKAVDLIKVLENAAQENNLKQEIQALNEEKDSLNFNLVLIGAFPDFLRFLEYIENSRYLMQISNIKIKALKNKEKQLTGNVQSNVQIKIFIN